MLAYWFDPSSSWINSVATWSIMCPWLIEWPWEGERVRDYVDISVKIRCPQVNSTEKSANPSQSYLCGLGEVIRRSWGPVLGCTNRSIAWCSIQARRIAAGPSLAGRVRVFQPRWRQFRIPPSQAIGAFGGLHPFHCHSLKSLGRGCSIRFLPLDSEQRRVKLAPLCAFVIASHST